MGAINQILETQESCKILACAPSNNAIDHLCEKIAEGNVDKHHLYRLYAATFPVEKIPYIRKVWIFFFEFLKNKHRHEYRNNTNNW